MKDRIRRLLLWWNENCNDKAWLSHDKAFMTCIQAAVTPPGMMEFILVQHAELQDHYQNCRFGTEIDCYNWCETRFTYIFIAEIAQYLKTTANYRFIAQVLSSFCLWMTVTDRPCVVNLMLLSSLNFKQDVLLNKKEGTWLSPELCGISCHVCYVNSI